MLPFAISGHNTWASHPEIVATQIDPYFHKTFLYVVVIGTCIQLSDPDERAIDLAISSALCLFRLG